MCQNLYGLMEAYATALSYVLNCHHQYMVITSMNQTDRGSQDSGSPELHLPGRRSLKTSDTYQRTPTPRVMLSYESGSCLMTSQFKPH